MLKFDKIKIISSKENIKILNENVFENKLIDGYIIEQRYSKKLPYSLYIEVDYKKDELVLEFSGKILGDDYPHLINRENIHTCLSNINNLGFCTLNIDAILCDGDVVKVDVSTDIEYSNCKALTQSIQIGIRNFKKHLVRNMTGNLVIEKNVQTKGRKLRLTIYDKGKEIRRAENRNFLSSLINPNALINYFDGKVRFELNLNSKEQLRNMLRITNTNIQAILNSTANPILEMLDEVLEDFEFNSDCEDFTELKNRLVLEYCDHDLAKVETLVRKYYSPNTHISQVMKPFRVLESKLSEVITPSIKQKLRNLFLEIVILIAMFVQVYSSSKCIQKNDSHKYVTAIFCIQ